MKRNYEYEYGLDATEVRVYEKTHNSYRRIATVPTLDYIEKMGREFNEIQDKIETILLKIRNTEVVDQKTAEDLLDRVYDELIDLKESH